jgi:uracil-DNA glycosylase
MWDEFQSGRGPLVAFDPGPTAAWAQLFAETPNYLGIGLAFSGDKFRWHFGPMFYRGRTAAGAAKVLVIGQEGAQDESLSHRSFTGGTGARMQNLLNHIGIGHSYMFLNTFVYPINGQYDGGFPKLGQDPRSPIAQHRNKILDLAANTHDLRLVVAVGKAAKESCVSWLKLHGGTAKPEELQNANGGVIRAGLRFVGVPHPGGASKGGNVTSIIAGFKAAISQIETWAAADAGWLPVDPACTRSTAASYKYRSAPIPFADFPFGTTWRLGSSGTSSNRRDGQTSIQLFSSEGKYNNLGVTVSYSIGPGSKIGYAQDAGDIEVEPPRVHPMAFDPGPGDFSELLTGSSAGRDWPNFAQLGLTVHPSFGFGPSYRGRLTNPSVLLLADQASHDDLFTGRALTGEAGQRLQGWLRAAGLTTRYAIVRTLPVDSLSSSAASIQAAVDHAAVRAILTAVIAKAAPKAVVAIGPQASRIAVAVSPTGMKVVPMKAWADTPAVLADWRRALDDLKPLTYTKDVTASFNWDGARGQIPREDLPYGTLRWQGSSGDRAAQARTGGAPNPDYFKFEMPGWAAALSPPPLSAADQAAVNALKS